MKCNLYGTGSQKRSALGALEGGGGCGTEAPQEEESVSSLVAVRPPPPPQAQSERERGTALGPARSFEERL